jgi:hypothetical protein
MTPKQFCQKYKIKNYTINSDGTIDEGYGVYLTVKLGDIEKLPVKFRKVSGSFMCGGNELSTLEGCPNYVGGDFNCRMNNLTTLEGCPKYVGGIFYCYGDILTHHILGNIQGNIYYTNRKRIVI